MREDHEKFAARGAVIVVTGPDDAAAFRERWAAEKYPFIGLPDPEHTIAKLLEQRWKLLGLGRLPSVIVFDREGSIRTRHDGSQMWDIPSNEKVLAELTSA